MAGLPQAMLQKKAKIKDIMLSEPIEQKEIHATEELPTLVKEAVSVEDTSPLDVKQFAVEQPEVKVEDLLQEKPSATKPSEDTTDWKWNYKRLEGNHQVVVKELKEARAKISDLEERFNAFQVKPNVPQSELDVNALPEYEEYREAIPFVSTVHKQLLQKELEPILKELEDLKRTNKNVATQVATSENSAFVQSLKASIKDYDKILTNHRPDWLSFIHTPLSPYTNKTINDALHEAHESRNAEFIIQAFNDFAKSKLNNAGNAYYAPSVNAASSSIPLTKDKTILKWSKRKEASKQKNLGLMDAATFNKIDAMYKKANEEGRIDFDK